MSGFLFEIKRRLRNTTTLFWLFIFPIVLCTLFSLVLGKAYDAADLEKIHISVIKDDNFEKDNTFQTVLEELSTGEDAMFGIHYNDKDIETLLNEEKRIALLQIDDQGEIHVEIAQNGVQQTIVINFVNQYMKQKTMIEEFIKDGVSFETINELFKEDIDFVQSETRNNANKSMAYVEYFSALAMACLYSGFFGINSMCEIQANLSEVAKRVQCSCQSKLKMILQHIIINNILCMALNIVQFIIMVQILKIDFGESVGLVLLTTMLGSFVGNGLGFLVGGINTNSGHKTTILSLGVLVMSFFAGMMVPVIKYLVHLYVPVLEYINPAGLLTDAYLRLSMYGVTNEFMLDVFCLLFFGILLYILSYFIMRRQQYESL